MGSDECMGMWSDKGFVRGCICKKLIEWSFVGEDTEVLLVMKEGNTKTRQQRLIRNRRMSGPKEI